MNDLTLRHHANETLEEQEYLLRGATHPSSIIEAEGAVHSGLLTMLTVQGAFQDRAKRDFSVPTPSPDGAAEPK